jgi:hypothetical protein
MLKVITVMKASVPISVKLAIRDLSLTPLEGGGLGYSGDGVEPTLLKSAGIEYNPQSIGMDGTVKEFTITDPASVATVEKFRETTSRLRPRDRDIIRKSLKFNGDADESPSSNSPKSGRSLFRG